MTRCETCKNVIPIDAETEQHCLNTAVPGTVLIAEDDPLIGQDLSERVEGLGYQTVAITALASEALSLAAHHKPSLVLMDIQLAGEMDGIQAAEQMRRLQVPVVFVTGCSSDTVLDRAVLTGPCGYLIKPYDTNDLKATIQVALHKHRAEVERTRLVARLKRVLRNVKTLRGRLSICAYCKRVKDGDGEWPQIEAYVMQHSHASFTHGMCPGCFDRVKAQLQALEEGAAGSDSIVLG